MDPRLKVLIVDDEDEVLASTALLIESLGYETVLLQDPAKVEETAAQERPGLLLQDLRMPGLNVAGLVASLRSNAATADIPLVFFSANADLPTIAARHDAWGYLPKPFTSEELEGLLGRVLGPPRFPKGAVTVRDAHREVRAVFHDHWNLLSAFSNYLQMLERKELDDEGRRCVRGLNDTLLRLESKTDRLRAYVEAFMARLAEKEPQPERRTEPGARGARTGAERRPARPRGFQGRAP